MGPQCFVIRKLVGDVLMGATVNLGGCTDARIDEIEVEV